MLQPDAAWGDQHGSPRDPQPGNTNGARDVRVTSGTLPLGSPGTAVTLTQAQTAALFTTPVVSGSSTIGAAEQSGYGLAISGIPGATASYSFSDGTRSVTGSTQLGLDGRAIVTVDLTRMKDGPA